MQISGEVSGTKILNKVEINISHWQRTQKRVFTNYPPKNTRLECRSASVCKCQPCMKCCLIPVCLSCDLVMRMQQAETQQKRRDFRSNSQSEKHRRLEAKASDEERSMQQRHRRQHSRAVCTGKIHHS